MKIGVLTSGGDAPGMNACIRAVVRSSIYMSHEVFGINKGYNGLIKGDIFQMNLSSVADIIHRGGTILGTARSDEFMTEEGRKKAVEVLKIYGIEGLVLIGGDGTFRGALELAKLGIKVIAIPATIDNDLGFTDYTIGFMTATETAVDAISKLRDTSSSHGRANVVEVMGRNCGDIALMAGLAGGAETIIVPEVDFSEEDLLKKALNGVHRGKKHHIIVVAEGAIDSYKVARELEEKAGIETKVTILGHIQRGGVPTVFDRIMASSMGNFAVNLLNEGKGGLALSFTCNRVIEMDIAKALDTKKKFNEDMLKIANILSI
ncbi:MAG: 6-phosphofructokinase [Ezakiella sp.]|nr:6-phosphofructokinase [Ezakiella sp.]